VLAPHQGTPHVEGCRVTISDEELSRWEALCAAATVGPWREFCCIRDGWANVLTDPDNTAAEEDIRNWVDPVRIASCDPRNECSPETQNNAAFIAAAREGWPATIAEVSELRASLADAEAERDRLREQVVQASVLARTYSAEIVRMRPVVECARRYVKRSGIAPRHERVACEADIERALETLDGES
jgi:hypothetical protein